MESITQLGKIAGIAGISIGAFVLIFRSVIRKNIFPMMEKNQAYKLVKLIIILTWSIAVLGISVWAFTNNHKNTKPDENKFQKLIPIED